MQVSTDFIYIDKSRSTFNTFYLEMYKHLVKSSYQVKKEYLLEIIKYSKIPFKHIIFL